MSKTCRRSLIYSAPINSKFNIYPVPLHSLLFSRKCCIQLLNASSVINFPLVGWCIEPNSGAKNTFSISLWEVQLTIKCDRSQKCDRGGNLTNQSLRVKTPPGEGARGCWSFELIDVSAEKWVKVDLIHYLGQNTLWVDHRVWTEEFDRLRRIN